ncbi:MAG: hypothetical protein M5U26_11565 [Planctomycetota bacterium]|nr:hypothetical protein [Planctomycetota bacterium]
MKPLCAVLICFVSLLITSLTKVYAEDSSAISSSQESYTPPPGVWLKVNQYLHVNPERAQALYFEGQPGKSWFIWLVDLAAKKAVRLRELPASLIERTRSHVELPNHAVLSADGTTIFLDFEYRADASELPNGRPVVSTDGQTGKEAIHALQTALFALPKEQGEPRKLTGKGDFNGWSYDPKTNRILAVASENNKTGLVVIKPDGTREQVLGMRPYREAGFMTLGGKRIPSGGNSECCPVALAGGRYFTAGPGIRKYAQGSAKSEALALSDVGGIFMLAALSDDELFWVTLGGRQVNGTREARFYSMNPNKKEPPNAIGKPVALYWFSDHHSTCLSGDAAALWAVTYRVQNRAIELNMRIDRIDLKTGAVKTFWTRDEIENLVKKASAGKK